MKARPTAQAPLRVLMVAPEFPPATGGMETHAWETARGLARRGHRVLVLTAAGCGAAPDAPGLAVRPVLGRDFRAACRRVWRAGLEFEADALLLMNAGFAPLAALPRAPGLPVVVRTAGNDAYGAWHGPRLPLRFLFWRLSHHRPGSIGARLRDLDQKRRVAAVLSGLARSERVLCNSRYTLDRLADLGVPRDRLRLLIGGVDPDVYRPRDPVATRDPASAGARGAAGSPAGAVLGIAARLKPIKGIEVALEMMAALLAAGRDLTLRIAGAGPLEDHLRARARALGIAARVEFTGDLVARDMPAFYQSLDLYLQPSVEVRHEASGMPQAESMGRGLCEAQACGVAVVASRSGGIPDVVIDGETGRLVPPGDAGRLAAAVAECLDAPRLRESMGAAGRRLILDRFTWEAVVEATEKALLEARPATGVRA